MHTDPHTTLHDAKHHLTGTRPAPLPPQRTFWGWVRAALAFQPAHPLPTVTNNTLGTEQPTSTASDKKPELNPAAVMREPGDETPHAQLEHTVNEHIAAMRRTIAAIPADRRLALRRHPVISACATSARLVNAIQPDGEPNDRPDALREAHLREVRALVDAVTLDLSNPQVPYFNQRLGRARDLDLAYDLRRDLDLTYAISRARNMSSTLAQQLGLARENLRHAPAHDIAHAINYTLGNTGALAVLLDGAIQVRRYLAHTHQHDHGPTEPLAHTLDTVLGRAHDIVDNLGLNLPRTRFQHGYSDPNPTEASAHARDLNELLNHAQVLAHNIALEHARDLARDLTEMAAMFLQLPDAPSEVLGQALQASNLDDFTVADLTNADLGNVDLQGVCWSVWGTQWPPAADVQALIRASREIDPGSGRYLIEDSLTSTADTSITL